MSQGMHEEGWILDAYIQRDEAVIWLHIVEGAPLRLIEPYNPSFYVLPKDEEAGRELHRILQQHPSIQAVALEDKHTTLGSDRKETLLHITLEDTLNYRRVKQAVQKLPQTRRLYNVDLLHVQQYLFTQLHVPPTSKVEVAYDTMNRIEAVRLIDDSEEIAPPPFTALLFDIQVVSPTLTPDPGRDPISQIQISSNREDGLVLQGEESEVLSDFNTIVGERDPDFVVCPRCDGFVVPYLFKRARLLGVDLQLGRERCDISKLRKLLPYGARGRVVLDYYMFGNAFGDWDLPGLVERSRFSFLPPGLAGRWSANRVIDSRNCYELIRRGYVIPENTGRYEYVRLMKEVVDRDRGGMIISPKIGVVHENVGQLDFESQYPHLILRNGLSYETVTPDGVFTREDALLPYVTKLVLDRRLRFKRLRKNYPKGSREWLWCEQRQEALKMVLVCLYGTSGCCWNRFGNVLCFEEINRRSRQALIRTKALVQRRGFEVVYADTDSIFIKKPGATRREYEEMSREIGEHLKLPIALDHHYKFLLLLPLESDPTSRMEAQKHYFGMLTNGELLTRGIECRRHDTPEFVKAFQEELIRILFDVQTAEEVRSIGYEKAVGYVHEVLDRIMSGDVSIDELVVSKVLRRPLPSYTRLFPHVSAAISLAQHGKMVREGETVDFVYVNAGHHNPLRRVAPYIIYDDDYYDREKYRDMVLDAAETVLSTFGFTRQKYGLKPKTNSFPEGLWRELREEVFLERETEELE